MITPRVKIYTRLINMISIFSVVAEKGFQTDALKMALSANPINQRAISKTLWKILWVNSEYFKVYPAYVSTKNVKLVMLIVYFNSAGVA